MPDAHPWRNASPHHGCAAENTRSILASVRVNALIDGCAFGPQMIAYPPSMGCDIALMVAGVPNSHVATSSSAAASLAVCEKTLQCRSMIGLPPSITGHPALTTTIPISGHFCAITRTIADVAERHFSSLDGRKNDSISLGILYLLPIMNRLISSVYNLATIVENFSTHSANSRSSAIGSPSLFIE